ncbi:hypothetical protein GGX14DRAFT_436809 [Mycena pura]|uniref:TERF2-interacting telomeric protein 1 Myb domain-containing protein n=1 Tax=Mycena pura TaxID=153505 RepID=A0AAD6YG62_9AGAR|nr:hypothetical protein GGX14DRAFT_436809 [Mycena pura]
MEEEEIVDDQIFVKDGDPLQIFLHHSIKLPGSRRALKNKITKYGGEINDTDVGSDVILVNRDYHEKIRHAYKTHSNPELKGVHVEKISWVDNSIKMGKCVHFFELKAMGGVVAQNHKARTEFTEEDDDHLIHYLAVLLPDQSDGGRQGHNIYKKLMDNAEVLPQEYKWAKRHTWQSWRTRYKYKREWFNAQIHAVIPTLDTASHQRYDYSQKATKRHRRQVSTDPSESEEVDDDDDGEEEEYDGNSASAKRMRISSNSSQMEEEEEEEEEEEHTSDATRQSTLKGKEKALPERISSTSSQMVRPEPEEGEEEEEEERTSDATRQFSLKGKERAPPDDDEYAFSPDDDEYAFLLFMYLKSLKYMRSADDNLVGDDLFGPEPSGTQHTPSPTQYFHSSHATLVGTVHNASPTNPPEPPRELEDVRRGSPRGKQAAQTKRTSGARPIERRVARPPKSQTVPEVDAPYRFTRSRSRSVEPVSAIDAIRKTGKGTKKALEPVEEMQVEEGNRPSRGPEATWETQEEEQNVVELLIDTNERSGTSDGGNLVEEEEVNLMPPPRDAIHPAARQPTLEPDDRQTDQALRRRQFLNPREVLRTLQSTGSRLSRQAESVYPKAVSSPRFGGQNAPSDVFSTSTRTAFQVPSIDLQNPLYSRSVGGSSLSRKHSVSSTESFPIPGTRARSLKREIKDQEKHTPYRPPLGTRAAAHLAK